MPLVHRRPHFLIRRPVLGVSAFLRRIDTNVVDNSILGVGRFTRSLSHGLKNQVSGHTQHYALIMAAAIAALLLGLMGAMLS